MHGRKAATKERIEQAKACVEGQYASTSSFAVLHKKAVSTEALTVKTLYPLFSVYTPKQANMITR